MKNTNVGLIAIAAAIAAAIVVVGALALGVPVATIATLGLVAVCPLMMFFMMRGMHGGGHDNQPGTGRDRRDPPGADDQTPAEYDTRYDPHHPAR